MTTEISAQSKRAIEDKLFFKFVSFNRSNEEELQKTIALTNFLKEDGERLVGSEEKKE